jgi:hypothetical protein
MSDGMYRWWSFWERFCARAPYPSETWQDFTGFAIQLVEMHLTHTVLFPTAAKAAAYPLTQLVQNEFNRQLACYSAM